MVGRWDGRAAVASILGHENTPLSCLYLWGEAHGSGDMSSGIGLPHRSPETQEKGSLIPREYTKENLALHFRAVE